MAYVKKRGDAWRAEVARLGVRDYATFPTKQEALNWSAKREAEILEGKGRIKVSHTVDEALAKYRTEVSPTKRGKKWEIVRLSAFSRSMPFASKCISDLTATDIAEWRDARLKVVTAGSVRREMALLRSVLEIARREWRWLSANPMNDVRKPPAPRHRQRIMAESERDAIVAGLGYVPGATPRLRKHRVAMGLLFALETGMRAGEVFGLEWGRVNLEQRYVTLETTKNDDRRDVPLSTAAVDILKCMPERTGMVFRVSTSVADAMFRKARNAANIADLHFHDSRATACTRLARKLNVLELARMIGHRDVKSLMWYYRESATALAERLD